MHFCQIFGLSKLLTGEENSSQNDLTGQEFGFQNHFPDIKLERIKTKFMLNLTQVEVVDEVKVVELILNCEL